ncbi:HisA/HisF-related TIM barrel protein [Aquabacter spiritensis]|uniref:Phosphoribosylformimino-5-aminoimidazole carboxamide ribotide isomerase n=1 Tax=Aquabacter spiritensis TaxID=933073 RepID=A0A4R3M0T4_9HYPH|nr:HisA/HisF-related TIM barrel protein [Aquabacter spiritensis]TCT04717.1 phosphoribosylformimino-5-aminoimidazole carboxamide ribotide isomerase [Aquabacter spiritensis]
MQVIPVLDLLGGQVVHARRGARHLYRPVVSRLADGADPAALVAALLALAPFRTLYIADLDAIAGRPGHGAAIADLRLRFPGLAVWVDAGESDPVALARRRAAGQGTPVVGSESLVGWAALSALSGSDFVLSLDRGADGPLGPEEVHEDPALWPERVIAMTLARVGSGAGPDLDHLAALADRAPGSRIFAAGGVRGRDDLTVLAQAGLAGVLVASALHDGTLGAADLAPFL